MDFSERVTQFLETRPAIHPGAFVVPGSIIVGDVTLGEGASVWFHATLRGDINAIRVGARSNIQDSAVVHVSDDYAAQIGELVTVGHGAVVHACTVDDEVLVGMGAIILDGAQIGARSIIGAGALVTGRVKIPSGSLVLGSPARVVRSLSLDEQKSIKEGALRYVSMAQIYRERLERCGEGEV